MAKPEEVFEEMVTYEQMIEIVMKEHGATKEVATRIVDALIKDNPDGAIIEMTEH